MKIAILTQPLRANYGGVLQNYALQQILIKFGHTPITIEKDSLIYISKFRLFCELPKRVVTKYILRKRKYIFSERNYNNYIIGLCRVLKPFVDKYINRIIVSDYIHTKEDLFDAYIVGSDQVWRPPYNPDCLYDMFLSFLPNDSNIKRIAYASSFGTNEWEYSEEQTSKCAYLIKKFDAVSIREVDGVNLCKKHLKRTDVIPVLDPTILLEKEEYIKLCGNSIECSDEFIFAYILDLDDNIRTKLKLLATKYQLDLKIISAHDDCSISMEEWLIMFRNAKFIITDSFHGTVFSIIFKKEFNAIVNYSRGNSRLSSLLTQLSLENRLSNTIDEIKFNNPINWNIVQTTLELLKKDSIDFLKAALVK